ncbi:hypothetical protein TD95_003278 [Thielaviopsis punctulata]|uniref:pectin lyase n=1 Tax=Thielaviopsis punctulata TaxID=72032 RepID=A0A0F4Z8P2_9PEZI|nr:hypothetical protein TD95_003278 [Thielaviopsis punctulata]
MKFLFSTILALPLATAQVIGKPFGFAADVTGGGDATPQYPKDIAELTKWLTDDTPRVIMIDKTFDFRNSEGTVTANCCSDPSTTVCSGGTSKGQLWLVDTCPAGQTAQTCSYDKAGKNPIDVGSNKSIVGVGNKGVISGKGLRMRNNNTNVIIQNIHITNLNPQYVWGGDIITMDETDLIWIDHCKFSLAGRQFLVSGWGAAGRVTISNNEFDGRTTWSAGCNGKHYWTMLFLGLKDFYTFSGNWIHDVSGRAPHMGTDHTDSEIQFQAINNYWQNVGGHAFDVDKNVNVLVEGSYFDNVTTPVTPTTYTAGGSMFFVQTVADAQDCLPQLGYICEWNKQTDSGAVDAITNDTVLPVLKNSKASLVTKHLSATDVPRSVVANAGVGK